jgi:glycosyltransferase involved in cell wall biosynthesis
MNQQLFENSSTSLLVTAPYSSSGLLQSLPSPPEGRTGWPWTEETPPLPPTMPNGQPWPKISIVTPSYNQGQFIEETIRCVLLQNYPNLEYIILDGGSTDATKEILERYSPWLSYVVSKPDKGQSDAIATGFELASGELLAWLCSDDLYLKGALQWAANQFIANPQIDLICGATNLDQGAGWFPWIETRYRYSTPTYPKLIACGQCIQQPGCFWTKRAYHKTPGVDRSLKFCMDYDLLLKLCRVGKAKYWEREIAWMRIHKDSKTSTLHDVHNKERSLIIDKALQTSSFPNFHLCTLSYLATLKYLSKTPQFKFPQRLWKMLHLAAGYFYHTLNGDIFKWHPVRGFCKSDN